MKYYRQATVSIMVLTSVFLLGFKNPASKPTAHAKNPLSARQQSTSKPLDLTLPVGNIGFEEQNEVLAILQNRPAGVIPTNNQARTRPIELQGRVIMSQEPEYEKSKTADGAGIIINLRH